VFWIWTISKSKCLNISFPRILVYKCLVIDVLLVLILGFWNSGTCWGVVSEDKSPSEQRWVRKSAILPLWHLHIEYNRQTGVSLQSLWLVSWWLLTSETSHVQHIQMICKCCVVGNKLTRCTWNIIGPGWFLEPLEVFVYFYRIRCKKLLFIWDGIKKKKLSAWQYISVSLCLLFTNTFPLAESL